MNIYLARTLENDSSFTECDRDYFLFAQRNPARFQVKKVIDEKSIFDVLPGTLYAGEDSGERCVVSELVRMAHDAVASREHRAGKAARHAARFGTGAKSLVASFREDFGVPRDDGPTLPRPTPRTPEELYIDYLLERLKLADALVAKLDRRGRSNEK